MQSETRNGDCKIDELTTEVKKAAELIMVCKKKLQSVDEDVNKAFDAIED